MYGKKDTHKGNLDILTPSSKPGLTASDAATSSFSSSTSIIDQCPVEIRRVIAFHLRSEDPNDRGVQHFKRLRLVNKSYAEVAGEELLSEIYLRFNSESFERMRALSTHRSHAKLVKSLRYEPTNTWNHHYDSRQNASHGGFDPGWDLHRAIAFDQHGIRRREDNRAVFAEVMARLTNLKEVIFNVNIEIARSDEVPLKCFRTALGLPGSDSRKHGMMQLRAMLLGAHDASAKLRTLKCGRIHWHFFHLPDKDMEKIKLAVTHLASLHVEIYAEEEPAIPDALLDKYEMSRFFSAAKNLQSLYIDSDEGEWTELKYWVGQNTWTFLFTVHLNYSDADEDTLI